MRLVRATLGQFMTTTVVVAVCLAPCFSFRDSPRSLSPRADWVPWVVALAGGFYLVWRCARACSRWEAARPRPPEPSPDPGPFKRGGSRSPTPLSPS